MNRLAARLLTRLYPRPWRERYGAEFETFLEDGHGSLRVAADVVRSAIGEHLSPSVGGNMERNSVSAILRHPSAFLPLAMSLAALSVLFVSYIYGVAHGAHGIVRQSDEGTAAHLWQIFIAAQLPILAFFAIKWLPRAPRQTLYVLALQTGAVLASMAPVFYLHL